MRTNLLYIDDDKDDHEVFKAALAMMSEKIHCTFMSNGRDALKKLEEKKLAPDLIFLDINMPIITGLQFLTEFKKLPQFYQFPVITFSTTSNPAIIRASRELGAIDYIVKPPSFDELIELLDRVLMQ